MILSPLLGWLKENMVLSFKFSEEQAGQFLLFYCLYLYMRQADTTDILLPFPLYRDAIESSTVNTEKEGTRGINHTEKVCGFVHSLLVKKHLLRTC